MKAADLGESVCVRVEGVDDVWNVKSKSRG